MDEEAAANYAIIHQFKKGRAVTLTINIRDNAVSQVMYLLKNLQKDVKIIDSDFGMDIEKIQEDDPDFQYIIDARNARKNGERTYSLDEIMAEFE